MDSCWYVSSQIYDFNLYGVWTEVVTEQHTQMIFQINMQDILQSELVEHPMWSHIMAIPTIVILHDILCSRMQQTPSLWQTFCTNKVVTNWNSHPQENNSPSFSCCMSRLIWSLENSTLALQLQSMQLVRNIPIFLFWLDTFEQWNSSSPPMSIMMISLCPSYETLTIKCCSLQAYLQNKALQNGDSQTIAKLTERT